MLLIIAISLGGLVLGACGTATPTPVPTVPLTVSEEVAIYTALFEGLGAEDLTTMRIAPETNRGGELRADQQINCTFLHEWLIKDMPDMLPEIMPAFCSLNAVSRPINPEVLRRLGLTPDPTRARVSVSAIQTDVQKRQAFVFIQLSGDFLHNVYVLLEQKNGVWRIRYKRS
jgi:hypothetical protein